jgi:molybdate/tungstate transport system substrate-binding protein
MSVVGLLLAACGGVAAQPAASPSSAGTIRGSGTVSVMYAASLTSLFEHKVAPAFQTATGFTFQGEGKGSVAIANLIKDKTRTPDVFVSADPDVNRTLQGPANGDYVSWWVPLARTEMVIGWSPKSKFANDFQAAKSGGKTWESVLEEPGLRLGRTDPELDPKGYRTLMLFQLDESRTGQSGEGQRILGPAGNAAQIFPEEQLVARLQAGELDAGFFYTIEAIEAELPYLTLPSSINQGDPAQADHYATATYTNKKGTTFKGSPAVYTVTVPSTAKNTLGAESFVQYLFGKEGQDLLVKQGLLSATPRVDGDPKAVPPAIHPFVKT